MPGQGSRKEFVIPCKEFLVLCNLGNQRESGKKSGKREWEEWKEERGKERRGKEKEMNKQTKKISQIHPSGGSKTN